MRQTRLPIWFAIPLLALLGGCGAKEDGLAQNGVPAKKVVSTDPWVMEISDAAQKTPALLWNGLVGVRLSRSANGLGPDGKPLGFFMIDEYERGGSENILPLPNPVLVSWAVGNQLYDGDKSKEHDFIKSGGTPLDTTGDISDYRQSLDMRTGVLRTEWKQNTPSAGLVGFRCDTVLGPSSRALAQRWTVTAERASSFTVRSLDYSGPNDPQEAIGADASQSVAITSSKTRAVTMQTKLSGTEPGASATVGGFRIQEGNLPAGKPVTFDRILQFGPHIEKPLPEFSTKNVDILRKVAPAPTTFDLLEKASETLWKSRWKTDLVIDGPPEDQLAVRSFLFYLRSSIAPATRRSVSPFALSDSQYNGHVFWDADTWVFPALCLIDPAAAKSISDYRLDKSQAAKSNFSNWAKGKQGGSEAGAKYPWESSETGKETAPGDSKNEEHITGSVVWELTEAEALGLAPKDEVDKIALQAGAYYKSRATRRNDGLSLDEVMSPDENHTGSNDLYTNLLADWLTEGRKWNSSGSVGPFPLPHDAQGFLTYDGDPVRSYKQAAAVLSIYPLQFPPAEKDARKMLERFEPKVIKNGPSMSDSLHALIWARSGDPDKGYSDWRESWQPFTQNDLMLFSEKRTKDVAYFTTGAAGSLQSVLYGFLGFRIDLLPQVGATWSKKLEDQRVLSIKPNLPSQWKSIKLTNFTVQNARYTVVADRQGVHVTTGE